MLSSPSASPRPSLTKPPVIEIPKPNPDTESPEAYLKRLMEGVTKAEVASVLASSGDAFHVAALQLYIDRFEFFRYSIDVALRRLLMDVGLPRETQQIDRVMECFASKYRQCNPDLFVSEDHPYILAFSLIMLHTDAFNKSNKRKMSKADYIKNTRLPGVAPEVLDYFYDNIVFAPFIFVEDPLDPRSSFDAPRLPGLTSASSLPGNSSTVTLLGKSTKIDPYYLITNDLLDPLRVDVAAYVSLEDPYNFEGTGGPWQEAELRRAFVSSHYIQVDAVESSRRMSTSLFALSVAGFPSPYPNLGAFPDSLLSPTTNGASALRVVKVGLLKRRDITAEGEKRGSKTKWREWSVILTGSQLLLFRDPVWATNLLEQAKRGVAQLLFPPVSLLKPDEILAVKDAVAVYDRSYARYQYAFRFVSGHGHHFLLQATDDPDMNEWISRINYASAFRSAGVNMRPLGLSGKDVELMGVAAAASHLRELQTREEDRPSSRVRTWDTRSSEELVDRLSHSPSSSIGHASRKGRGRTVTGRDDIQLEAPTAPDLDGAQQFKAAFDQVKADLAAGRLAAMDDYVSGPGARPRAYSLESTMRPSFLSDDDDSQRSSSRTQRIQVKIGDLELRIESTQLELDSHLRLVRNIATLTPFTRATRERLQIAVQRAAKQIKHARLDLARLNCHCQVLQNDLSAEEWDWNRTKTIALKAATKTLYSRRDPSIPRMTLSLHLDEPSRFTSSPRETSFSSASSHQRESSLCDSFHSALDFQWSSSPVLDVHVYGESPLLDSPLATPMSEEDRNGSASSFPFQHGDGSFSSQPKFSPSLAARSMTRLSNGTDSSGVRSHHEKFVTAPEMLEEEAEEWNKTRAAKRVSLVKVPSDLRMGLAIGRTGTNSPQPSTRTIRSPLLKPER
ncbi:hypothetical protein EWM64_g2470 [Hericium alpestre]|uniref:SEC7 domain-containing protein n=1 Tax=Hericium alpestre TaxID=135208 RepID=A0A4Z0A7C9_9AGAM|nr:hypothetical protein EWM64_g2470 [Hericium alpestre]